MFDGPVGIVGKVEVPVGKLGEDVKERLRTPDDRCVAVRVAPDVLLNPGG